MARFISDLAACIPNVVQFFQYFVNSFWVYPIVFLFFVYVFLYIVGDLK